MDQRGYLRVLRWWDPYGVYNLCGDKWTIFEVKYHRRLKSLRGLVFDLRC